MVWLVWEPDGHRYASPLFLQRDRSYYISDFLRAGCMYCCTVVHGAFLSKLVGGGVDVDDDTANDNDNGDGVPFGK